MSRQLITRGQAGPRGADGTNGLNITLTAGEQIFGGRALVAVDGQLFQADPSQSGINRQIIGVALGAAPMGALATAVTAGKFTEPGWTWVPGPVFAGLGGILTQVVPDPVDGFAYLAVVGTAISDTEIVILPRLLVEF